MHTHYIQSASLKNQVKIDKFYTSKNTCRQKLIAIQNNDLNQNQNLDLS